MTLIIEKESWTFISPNQKRRPITLV